MSKASNLEGTHENEFYLGKGDIDDPSANVIGLRTNGGEAEYKEAGDVWKPFASGGFDVDDILVNQFGEVLANAEGNVLLKD